MDDLWMTKEEEDKNEFRKAIVFAHGTRTGICRPSSHARVAQLVERWTFNPTVQGSSPFPGGISFCFAIFFYL